MVGGSVAVMNTTSTDPVAALIAAHAPTTTAELLRPIPAPSQAAVADRARRDAQRLHNQLGTPRHLIAVEAIR